MRRPPRGLDAACDNTCMCELALPHGSTLSALQYHTLLMPELLVGRVGCAALAAGTAAAARTSLPLLLLLPLLLFLPLLLLLGCLRPVFSSSCSMSLRFNSRSNLQAHQATGVGCEHKQAAILRRATRLHLHYGVSSGCTLLRAVSRI